MLGPRVIFKDDRDSNSGRGCRLYSNHFTPTNMNILMTAVNAYASMPSISLIKFTEGYRKIRETRDLHEECRAFDSTAIDADGHPFVHTQYELVAEKIRQALGKDYDVIVHDAGFGLHIHVEYDPKFKKLGA